MSETDVTNLFKASGSPVDENGAVESAAAPNAPEIGLDAIRLPQDFAAHLGVRKLLVNVPVRKPDRHAWVRVHPNPEYQIAAAILELKETHELLLAGPDVLNELARELRPTLLVTAITRQRNVFLWPIALPDSAGRHNSWNSSLMEAADQAKTVWVRVASNMAAGAYDIFVTTANLEEPEWPTESFEALIRIAFKDRYLDSLDHPIVRRLRGLD
jgi:hypothetical protein